MSLYGVVHIEMDIACLFLLVVILYRMSRNVNKEQSRIVFFWLNIAIAVSIVSEIVCVLLNGASWPIAIGLSYVINIVRLSLSAYLGMHWWVYALSALNYFMSKKQRRQ